MSDRRIYHVILEGDSKYFGYVTGKADAQQYATQGYFIVRCKGSKCQVDKCIFIK